ncbi:MAG: peptide chain release factor 2, partial [Thermotoga sp.]|nr:peptide chain release factor 2 [Thermotoga sp.]
MISFETRTRIEELEKKYKDVLSVVNENEVDKEIEEIEKKLTDPSVWDDQKKAREYTQKLKRLKSISEDLKRVRSLFEDLEVAIELSDEDQEMAQHVEEIVQELEDAVKKLELEIILNGKYDPNNAYLSVHPGAGGTESQDWAQMLLRMYMRWAERKGFDVEIVELQPGEEAGIKDATILIKGEYAYGYLKHESGVHRLVRISPFDAARRRHTSFASVNVIPEIDDDVDIEIRPED